MRRFALRTQPGGELDLGDEEACRKIIDHAVQIADLDRLNGWELRSLLNIALVFVGGDARAAAYLLQSAATVTGHACRFPLDEMQQTLAEGYQIAGESDAEVAAARARGVQ